MAKKIGSGTDKAAIRSAGRKGAHAPTPRSERRVTCTGCNGAGQVTSGVWDRQAQRYRREACGGCNGAGQVTA